ncbi:MAG: hypothetical protein ACRDRN_22490 [Sciscionella sp.]
MSATTVAREFAGCSARRTGPRCSIRAMWCDNRLLDLPTGADLEEQIERLGNEVLPALREGHR